MMSGDHNMYCSANQIDGQEPNRGKEIMNDKELLELAAKAAGYKEVSAVYHSDDDGYLTDEFWYLHVKELGKRGHSCAWNPLTDDGDALRLAVKLKLKIFFWEHSTAIVIPKDATICEHFENDPYAATRRAIVRAAAEIGKEMK